MTTQARDYSVFEADLTGRSLSARLLKRLLSWLKPYRRQILISAILVLASSFAAVLMPVVMTRVIIDGLLYQHESAINLPDFGMTALTQWLNDASGLSMLVSACVLYAMLAIFMTTCAHFHRMTLAKAVLSGLRDLRRDLFAHLERKPSMFYDHVAVGRVMTRVTNDIENLYEMLAGFGMVVGEFVPFFVALILMLSIDVQLTMILLLVIPIVAIVTYLFRMAMRDVFRRIRNSVSLLNQYMQENLVGIQVVQLSGRQQKNQDDYGEINKNNRREEMRAIDYETAYGIFNDSMANLAIAVIIWFGGGAVVQEQISLGSLVLFTQFINMLLQPVVAIGDQLNILFRAMASAERIFQALDWNESIREPEKPTKLPIRLQGHIEFRHLNFAYKDDSPVLQDVSFDIKAGEKLAIVGPTGSGKSTLIRLLGRFYEVEDNCLFLDGVDINQISSLDLRHRIGVVLQDFHIFSGTIRENIMLSNTDVTPDRAEEAARLVNADGFIRALPLGYETPLTERGQNLSQGQRQLLAFARVLAADPEILVLDEATANIDTETELVIQDALRTLTAGRTSILIAHRLQTIQEADRILVLQHGEVRETGTHEELLAQDGVYRKLYELQFQSV